MKNTYISKEIITYLYLPIIIDLYLIINFILLQTNNYCNTEGCGLTKSLLNIDQSYLYILSILGFSFLSILGYLSLFKNINFSGITNEILLKIFNIILFCIVSMESIFISFLYLSTSKLCIICMFFYILILINLIFVSLLNNRFHYLIIIPSIIIALSFLKINNEKQFVFTNNILLINENNNELEVLLKNKNINYIKDDYKKYLNLVNTFELDSLPILILKDNNNNIVIINSEEKIKDYLK